MFGGKVNVGCAPPSPRGPPLEGRSGPVPKHTLVPGGSHDSGKSNKAPVHVPRGASETRTGAQKPWSAGALLERTSGGLRRGTALQGTAATWDPRSHLGGDSRGRGRGRAHGAGLG